MTGRIPETVQEMKSETVESLQELVRALRDSIEYHTEAADKVDDGQIESVFREIASERKEICDALGRMITLSDDQPAEDGTFMGSLRAIWTKFRASLNGGDATVVLIEAERAEDVIVAKFKEILPEVAGNPVNDQLLGFFGKVKAGHDQVLKLRNAYQDK